ncbi:cytochrome c family protein [Lentibacter algarum]|uniref:c-type cytochrome n=1 Tax=Lentibacter algarum TaxID=576131 RepID=UPI001C0782BE|nr:cytochrome c family protein [Lentibacter algarum]MBU2981550.1 cytochrome c family protein [Lentibacter algarum]
MFDTMTSTKVLGAVCGSLLVFLFAKWGGEALYHVGATGHGGHGEGEIHAAYIIETGDDSQGDAEAVDEGPDFATLLAEADVGKGASVFKKCAACHSLEAGETKTGPSLHGIVGKSVASTDGFGYSGALKAVAETWGTDELNAFLTKPKSFAPGTAMSFNGLKKDKDRANLIAYLESLGG